MNLFNVMLMEEKETLFAKSENFKFAIPDTLKDRFSGAKGRDLILGIRPEHIYDKKIKSFSQGCEHLKTTIEVVEPIGSQVILLATCGSDQITACVDPHTKAKPHMNMEFFVDMNNMHLYDRSTGESF